MMRQRQIHGWILILCFVLLNLSCDKVQRAGLYFDSVLFSWSGETLFTKPEVKSLKEIHLGADEGISRKLIIVGGEVLEAGPQFTYLVLGQGADRLIVNMSAIEMRPGKSSIIGTHVSVIGHIDLGQKGIPFLKAQSVSYDGSHTHVKM